MANKTIQTKRNPRNKHNWEKHVGYASRILSREKYFKIRNNQRGIDINNKSM